MLDADDHTVLVDLGLAIRLPVPGEGTALTATTTYQSYLRVGVLGYAPPPASALPPPCLRPASAPPPPRLTPQLRPSLQYHRWHSATLSPPIRSCPRPLCAACPPAGTWPQRCIARRTMVRRWTSSHTAWCATLSRL